MKFMFPIPLLLLASGCSLESSIRKVAVDADGDGFDASIDCDDTHAVVNPDAPELCDELDNDCDGDVDEDAADARIWYPDTDSDGYGSATGSVSACDAPDGHVETATDCDDTLPDAYPGGIEVCGGGDEDCDGQVDEADAAGQQTWYADDDADGYGDDGRTTAAGCEAPEGYVAVSGDCADTDPAVHPGATEADCADPTDYDCDGVVAWADEDADGWAACEDCDDDDAAVSPSALEVCDAAAADEDCDGLADDDDPDVSDAPTWYRDADLDAWSDGAGPTAVQCEAPTGYTDALGDCDDHDAAVSPAATEVCDASDTDEDCNGVADDDDAGTDPATWSAWYRDADGDGYGTSGTVAWTCEAPSGYVADSTDCDDGDSAVNPDASERCDASGTDEDCDGLADDADADALDQGSWYADADADGYGAGAAVAACTAPAGHVADASDCDDTDGAVSPAGAEVCDAADVDEDCDGLADDADPSASGGTAWYGDADADGWGAGTATIGCAAPSGAVADDTDCHDGDAAVNPGAAELCDPADTDEDCDGVADDAGASGCVVWYADADSDGWGGSSACLCDATAPYTQAVSGDCDDADAAISPSATEVCGDGVDDDCDGVDGACPASGIYYDELDSSAKIYGAASSDAFGWSIGAGDFDGDGSLQVAVGGVWNDTGGSNAGAVYVFEPPASGTVAEVTSVWTTRVSGSSARPSTGAWLAGVGDLDGDGDDELAVADGFTETYLYEGPVTGTWSVSTATAACTGSPRPAGDTTGSGLNGVLCGYNLGGTSSSGETTLLDDTGVLATIQGATAGDQVGLIHRGGQDMDGDGLTDVWVASPYVDTAGTNAGAAYLFLGPISGAMLSTDADAWVYGEASDYLGYSLALSDDLDGDGLADALVGAYADAAGGSSSGSIFLCSAPWSSGMRESDAFATVYGADSDRLGHRGAATDDRDQDGALDLLAGTHVNGSSAGAVYLAYGPHSGTIDFGDGDYDAIYLGGSPGDYSGWEVAAPGDLDGDGLTDFLVAGFYVDGGAYTDPGGVYFFY